MNDNKRKEFFCYDEEIENLKVTPKEMASMIKTMTKANGVIIIIKDAELKVAIGGVDILEEETPVY